jgi:hypothetical protein
MAGQQRNMEGNEEQRRQKGREAKAQGKRPSEMGATTGASKQRKEARSDASHQERLEQTHEGKQQAPPGDQPRPGSRDTDPKRTEKWK